MIHGGDFFNKSINKISGPVSMYYLKPNYEIIKDNNINLPLFLLFGDFHFSYDNMCSECTCEKTSKTCCSKIYSGDFIKTINNLSTPTRPIDFYTEYFDDNDDGGFDGPLDKFREPEFQPCYKKDIKAQKEMLEQGNFEADWRAKSNSEAFQKVSDATSREEMCC